MDDEAVKRMQKELDANGVKVELDVLRKAVTVAETPPPPAIPVSKGMIDVGRKYWVMHPDIPPNLLVENMWRAMEQQRRDENKEHANGG